MHQRPLILALSIPLAGLLLCTTSLTVFAQQDGLTGLIKKFNGPYNFQEKLFVHTDRTFYLTGETMWFKVYVVDRNSNKPSDLSKVAYIELTDRDNEKVLKVKIPLVDGMGDGTFFFPTSLRSGTYNVVAYTRWMGNFSPDFYFQQEIKLVNPFVVPAVARTARPAYDIQFFPEGGNLVTGLKNNLAFRVVGKNGKGIKFKGFLVSSKNDTIARFSPWKFGLGQFPFTPQAKDQYRAVIIDSTGHVSQAKLPNQFDEGCVMAVTDTEGLVNIEIQSTWSDPLKHTRLYLAVHARNILQKTQGIDLINGSANVQIEKKAMREGVNKITLFDENLNPISERSFYIPTQGSFKIQVEPDRSRYQRREKISLSIFSPERDSQQKANLSLAVFREDSLAADEVADLPGYLYLTSELRGVVESPGYYLKQGIHDHQAIDNLMLTHGWSRFRWENNNVAAPVRFVPEHGGHLISARVLKGDGSGAKGINTYLSVAGKDGRLYLAQSDDQGTVHYDLQNFFGERKVILQTNSETDSTYRIELADDDTQRAAEYELPELDLSIRIKKALTDRSVAMQLQHAFTSARSGNRSLVVDTIPFYGKPDEKYLLDDFTRFPTMEEVMREYVKGVMVRRRNDKFHFLTIDRTNKGLFKENPLVLLDGVPIFDINKIMSYDPRKVQQLDVMTRQFYLGRLTFNGVASFTTYQGDLVDFTPEKSHVFLVEGLQANQEFFSPVYETTIQRESRIPDRRHLLLWAPSVKCDRQGKTHVEFYASDVSGHYRVVVQGLSSDGTPGMAVTHFEVEKEKPQ